MYYRLSELDTCFLKKKIACAHQKQDRDESVEIPHCFFPSSEERTEKRMDVRAKTIGRSQLLKIHCPQVTEIVAANSNAVPFLISWLREDSSNIT